MHQTDPRFVALALGFRVDALAPELDALGITMIHATDDEHMLAQLETLREVSVLLLSSELGRDAASALLLTVKRRYATLPTLWVGDLLGGAPLSDFRTSPDAIVHRPASAQAISERIQELLLRPYSGAVSSVLDRIVSDVLVQSYAVQSSASPVHVNAIHRLVNDVNSIVAFCGSGISGWVLISAPESTLSGVYRQAIDRAANPGSREAHDLAGEISNLVAGKLKFTFDQLGVPFEIGTPLGVGPAGIVLKSRHERAALCVEFETQHGPIRAELTIDRCTEVQAARLSEASSEPIAESSSELCFFE